MEAQDQTQMFTGIVKKVKCEAAKEEQSLDVEDRLTVSQLLVFGKSPIDLSPKVYTVRARDVELADGLSLPNSIACAKETGFENIETCEKEVVKGSSSPDWNHIHSSNTTKGSTYSGFVPDIKDFNIVVNGITIDSLSTHVLTKYYHLCCNQKSNIHEGLFNSNIAAVIISETVNIADAIRASHISTSPDDLVMLDKTLEAFQLLGMNVQFLRDRLSRLLILSLDSREGTKRHAEASTERERVQREMTSLELELLGMKQQRKRLDYEIKDLKEKARENECLFQRETTAPW